MSTLVPVLLGRLSEMLAHELAERSRACVAISNGFAGVTLFAFELQVTVETPLIQFTRLDRRTHSSPGFLAVGTVRKPAMREQFFNVIEEHRHT